MIGRTNAVVGGGSSPDPNTKREIYIENYTGYTIEVMYILDGTKKHTTIADLDATYIQADINSSIMIFSVESQFNNCTISNTLAQGTFVYSFDYELYSFGYGTWLILPIFFAGDDANTPVSLSIA